MGLDNGICLRSKKALQINEDLYCMDCEVHEDQYEYDIAYWRKCYGLRDFIKNAILKDRFPELGYCELTTEDLQSILTHIINLLQHPDYWGDSIWVFDEIRNTLAQQVGNISFAIDRLKDPAFQGYAYFYDSY